MDTTQAPVKGPGTGAFSSTSATGNITVFDPQIVNLVANTGVTVTENATVTITTAMLAYNDDGGARSTALRATDVTYTLTQLPADGVLKLSGAPLSLGSTFTQDDINNNRITYVENGAKGPDSFLFTVRDDTGPQTAAQTFAITVLDPGIVTLIANTGLTVNENATATVSYSELAYSNNGGAVGAAGAVNTIYTVTTLPTLGTLERPVRRSPSTAPSRRPTSIRHNHQCPERHRQYARFIQVQGARHQRPTIRGADLHHHHPRSRDCDSARQYGLDGERERHRDGDQCRAKRIAGQRRAQRTRGEYHLHHDHLAHGRHSLKLSVRRSALNALSPRPISMPAS